MMVISTEDLVVQFNYSAENNHSVETLMVIQGLVYQSLSPQLTQVFDLVLDLDANGGFVTSGIVSKHFNYSINHASTMLKKLSEYQLLNRIPHVDANGLTYHYTIKGISA